MMRVRRKRVLVYILFILVVPYSAFCGPNSQGDSTFPKVHVPEGTYEFEPVVEGTNVIHDFVIQNKGTATLDITKVRPG